MRSGDAVVASCSADDVSALRAARVRAAELGFASVLWRVSEADRATARATLAALGAEGRDALPPVRFDDARPAAATPVDRVGQLAVFGDAARASDPLTWDRLETIGGDLAALLARGAGTRELLRSDPLPAGPYALITGGAGFIGCNLADRLLEAGERVVLLDSLARPGVEGNLRWLRARHGERFAFVLADLRDRDTIARVVADGASSVFHLAAQVAVTTSLLDPMTDFTVNLAGTLGLLEAVRRHRPELPVVFASTNKVYGDLADVTLARDGDRWLPTDPALRAHGIDERRPLDFHTPYGCSKGAADQYVLDYARSFGLRAVVLRMSCIYGRLQLGNEDQGWVAHFGRAARRGDTVTLYGDGCQVRDILDVGDAVSAYVAARGRAGRLAGRALNLGGGPENAVSLLALLDEIGRVLGRPVARRFAGWRTGDQRYFVADARAARNALSLPPPLGWRDGVARLLGWIGEDGAECASQVRADAAA